LPLDLPQYVGDVVGNIVGLTVGNIVGESADLEDLLELFQLELELFQLKYGQVNVKRGKQSQELRYDSVWIILTNYKVDGEHRDLPQLPRSFMIRLARLLESFGHFSLHNPNLDHGNCKQYEDAGDVHVDSSDL